MVNNAIVIVLAIAIVKRGIIVDLGDVEIEKNCNGFIVQHNGLLRSGLGEVR